MELFIVSKRFPVEVKYELTDQKRRSSRAVCRAIGARHRKRQYPIYYLSKMTDADMDNPETQVSLVFALACQYISNEEYQLLGNKSEEKGQMLHHVIENPEKYMSKAKISSTQYQ